MLLSIMGLYEQDNNIFEGLQLPDGLNREAAINEILLQCAELEIAYPDIDIMKLAITTWSLGNQYKWSKLYDTMVITYNPIWNVDADITENLTGSDSRKTGRNRTGSDKRTIDGADKRTLNTADNRTLNTADNRTLNTADNETINITDTKSVKGFNSNTWAESEKNDKSGTDNIAHTGTDNVAHTGTDNVAHTGTDNITHTGTDNVNHTDNENVTDEGNMSETRTTRRTGNIGVTTTQQMLEQERQIAEFNMISYIAQSFKERFCLLVY